MKYHELNYTLPTVSAKDAAAKAVHILEDVAATDPACLFYLMQASNILALAGLRAQSPYNEFEPGFPAQKRELMATMLSQHGYKIMVEDFPYKDTDRKIFSIMCVEAFLALPDQYKVLGSVWKPPQAIGDFIDFCLWSSMVETSLASLMQKNELPSEWLRDWWAPHHVRFGMLLGYPGPAISSGCWLTADELGNGNHAKQVDSPVDFYNVYDGASLTYCYEETVQNELIIKTHQELWQTILDIVYTVFPPERTAKMPKFAAEAKRYHAYDEGFYKSKK